MPTQNSHPRFRTTDRPDFVERIDCYADASGNRHNTFEEAKEANIVNHLQALLYNRLQEGTPKVDYVLATTEAILKDFVLTFKEPI